jgi:hypothetical protein
VALKLNLAVIAASIAGAVIWIEQGHRIDIATPTGAAFAAPVAAVCPESENVPYSADCIVFMQGDAGSGAGWQAKAETAASVPVHVAAESHGPACPHNNENAPYSARCLRFLSGWFWQANPAAGAAPK